MIRDGVLRGTVVFGIAVVAIVIVQNSGFVTGIDSMKTWMDHRVVDRGGLGVAVFVGVSALLTAVGVSRQLFAYVGGYAFGAILGTALTLSAEMIGVAASFACARYLAGDFVVRRHHRRLRKINALLEESPFQMTLIVRLLPISNNLIVNLAAGVSRIRFAPFMWASLIGHFPQTLVFALLGAGLSAGGAGRGVLAVVLFVVSSLLALRLYRVQRASTRLDPGEIG